MSTETVDQSPKGDSPVPLPETAPAGAQGSAELDTAIKLIDKVLLAFAFVGTMMPGIWPLAAIVPFVIFSLFVWRQHRAVLIDSIVGRLLLIMVLLGLRFLVASLDRRVTAALLVIVFASIASMFIDLSSDDFNRRPWR